MTTLSSCLVLWLLGVAPPGLGLPTLSVGTEGTFQPGLLLQGWNETNQSSSAALPSNTFRLRRAEVHLKGEVIPQRVSYRVMVDFAKVLEPRDVSVAVLNPDGTPSRPAEQVTVKQPVSPLSALQDFLITFQMLYGDVTLGQFKNPVSWEGTNQAGRLLFAERAVVSREYGAKQDLGLRVAKAFKGWSYLAGIFNGAGANNLDTNLSKDLSLRLEGYPIEGLTLAGVIYATVGHRFNAGSRDRYEADLRFERGRFLFQSEYIRAREVGAGREVVYAHGFYAAVAFSFFDCLQPAVRVGYYDPDLALDVDPALTGRDELWHYDVGLNYYLRGQEAKLQAQFSRFQYQDKPAADQLILAAQIWF